MSGWYWTAQPGLFPLMPGGFLRYFVSPVIASRGGFEGWSGWDLLVPLQPYGVMLT